MLRIQFTLLPSCMSTYLSPPPCSWPVSPLVRPSAEAHLNTSFRHFLVFADTFKLVDAKDLAPLDDLIFSLTGGAMGVAAAGAGGDKK